MDKNRWSAIENMVLRRILKPMREDLALRKIKLYSEELHNP
jgi:hypothetical protein